MKNIYLLALLGLFFFASTPATAVHRTVPTQEKEISEAGEKSKEEWKDMTRKERKAKRKEFRKEIKKAIREWRENGEQDTDLILLVILAIILPPLAMGLYDGITNRFWISLLLTLLLWLPGVIYTLIVILGEQ